MGRVARIHPRPYGVSQCCGEPAYAGTWRFRKNSLCFPGRVGGNPRPIPPPRFPVTRRRLIRGINSARVTKNRGGENRGKIYDDPVSVSLTRDSTSLPIFRRVTRNLSTLSRFRGTSSEAGTTRYEHPHTYLPLGCHFRSLCCDHFNYELMIVN